MEDLQIVELYWQRDPQAITQSKEKYGIYCFAVANHVLANWEDSEECVNDTWLYAWNKMPPHRPRALKFFLAKITRRVAFNRFKAHSAQKRGGGQLPLVLDELAECIKDETDVEDSFIAKELGECVKRFVTSLPAREGDIFARRYFFTESISEIASNYGLTDNHVSVLLNRTRKKLRQCLIKEGFLDESEPTV